MNKREARALLQVEIERLRVLPYEAHRARIPLKARWFLFVRIVSSNEAETHEVTGDSGTTYQVITQVFWDDKRRGDIRVTAAIDDGGASAFKPMSDDFIVAAEGNFVGE